MLGQQPTMSDKRVETIGSKMEAFKDLPHPPKKRKEKKRKKENLKKTNK